MADDAKRCLTVLVVEDDDDTRRLLCEFFKLRGVKPIEARNGVEAIQVAEAQTPGLIFMDLSMPEMDGIAAARRIRLDDKLRDIPIVFLTAHGSYGIRLFEDLDLVDVGGPIEYMTKPVDTSQLDEVLRNYAGL